MSGIGGWFKRLGIYGYILIGLLIVIAAYFIIIHQAHLAAYSTIIFLLIFIGLHLLMHVGGHGSHGGHEENEHYQHGGGATEREDKQKSIGKTEIEDTGSGGHH